MQAFCRFSLFCVQLFVLSQEDEWLFSTVADSTVLLYINLLSINDVQALLQGAEALALKVIDEFILCYLFIVI